MSGSNAAREIDSVPKAAEDIADGLDGDAIEIAEESGARVEELAPIPPSTAGGLLRTAREEAGLSVADVAEVLRFSAHQIEALERDDHTRLAGSTLVRGMIRGYAKLLKIKSEPLLIGLGGEIPGAMPYVRAPTNIGLADKTTTVARISRGAVVALVVVVLLFAALTGYVYLMSDVPPAPAPAPAANATQNAPTVAPVAIAPGPQMPMVVADANLPTAPAQEAVEVLLPKANALVVDFDELSWIEVTDATQSIVFRGEQPKGTHQVIEGKAPFQLWIGRASAVRVSFGDRAIDLKPYSRENVARLTVE